MVEALRSACARVAIVCGLLVCLPAIRAAADLHAMTDLDVEREVADLIDDTTRSRPTDATAARRWGVLPIVGFGPETGAVFGAKFTHRDLRGTGVTLDFKGTWALEGQVDAEVAVGTPHLLDDRALAFASLAWDTDPRVEFFGLGNNDVGPDELSTHELQRLTARLTLGWRPWPRLAVLGSVAFRDVAVRRGDLENGVPSTVDRFPDLPGIDGGQVVPLGLALVYSGRDGAIVPTRGFRAIAKVSHTSEALGSDFEFTRWFGELSYLWSFCADRHAVGMRVNGSYVDGPSRDVPFWELAELGGDDTLRGFFPHRFRGTSHVLGTLEYRVRLTSFDFFDLWHVRIHGVAFGEGGRVFIDDDEVEDEFRLDDEILDRIVSNLRYSYGGGLRIALSDAILARIDVGFSEEETGLVYLAFGHTF